MECDVIFWIGAPDAGDPETFEKRTVNVLINNGEEHFSVRKSDINDIFWKEKSFAFTAIAETTVILKIKNNLFTSVVFGGADFPVDGEIGLELDHDNYLLFDKTSGENIGTGSLSVFLK